jgi:diguanylate cyclase (GGDEF)-like protein
VPAWDIPKVQLHQAGDMVLCEVARRVTEMLRPYDSFGRYGGEELLIVLPECDATDALTIAERVRSGIADQPITTKFGLIPTSISLGVAMADKETLLFDELIRRADDALYQAKKEGRNRVVFVSANLRGEVT